MHSGIEKIYLHAIILFICSLFMVLSPQEALSQMQEVSDVTLSHISARSGISMWTDITMRVTADSLAISDTDHSPPNWIEFNNFTLDAHVKTPDDTPITLDVGTNSSGTTIAGLLLSQYTEPRTYNVGNFVFCSQDIGSLSLDQVTLSPISYMFSAHSDGTTGIDFELKTGITINDFLYTYNTTPASLDISGIHASASASGAPEDPSTWTYTGDFQVGDLDGSAFGSPAPATMDVGTDSSTGKTSLCYNLPMKGTVRVEDVKFGSNDFGPSAIDGITIHHLSVQMVP